MDVYIENHAQKTARQTKPFIFGRTGNEIHVVWVRKKWSSSSRCRYSVVDVARIHFNFRLALSCLLQTSAIIIKYSHRKTKATQRRCFPPHKHFVCIYRISFIMDARASPKLTLCNIANRNVFFECAIVDTTCSTSTFEIMCTFIMHISASNRALIIST